MNILSIGNSYSMDAQRYLHQIAEADGVELCHRLVVVLGEVTHPVAKTGIENNCLHEKYSFVEKWKNRNRASLYRIRNICK